MQAIAKLPGVSHLALPPHIDHRRRHFIQFRDNELVGLSSSSVPCAVVWSLVMRELIQGLNFEWSWTYEHVRTGVGFGLNVLGGGR